MVKELTDNEFDGAIQPTGNPVLVDFSATWCQPCKALAPVIDAVAKEYNGKLEVYKVDIDKANQTAVRFGIQGVPTCIFFKGGTEVDRFVGYKDLREIKERVTRVLA
jgi:thioredoxin 1